MNTLFRITILCLIVVGIYFFTKGSTPLSTPETSMESTPLSTAETENVDENPATPSPEGDPSIIVNEDQGVSKNTSLTNPISLPQENATWTISYSYNGFSPKTLSIKKGDIVRFINNSDSDMWVASNPHPSHTDLSTLDAGKVYGSGEIYLYTFRNVGTWGYHEHTHSSFTGTVTVK